MTKVLATEYEDRIEEGTRDHFKILAIDGGGFRGVYAAHILKRVEEEYSVNWRKHFQLIAGTSTGSIIAAGLACGLSASEIADLYRDHGKRIFKKRWLCRMGILASRYRMRHLGAIIRDAIGERTLGDVETPLILPATDIGNGAVYVFKSAYDKTFVRDKNVLVCDAVLASCAAPTYFDPHTVDGKYLLADGGLWANSPALVAAIDAKRRLGQDLSALRIFSIGTGNGRSFYSLRRTWWKKPFGWGFATRWNRGRFIAMLLNLQAQNANNMLTLLLQADQILRINFESDISLSLDDPKEYHNLITRADRDFTYHAHEIQRFLEVPRRTDQPGEGLDECIQMKKSN